jgi:rare lipoprotein A (peptidoglycan hydrolase)
MTKFRLYIRLSLIAKALTLTMVIIAFLLAFGPQIAHTPKTGPGMAPMQGPKIVLKKKPKRVPKRGPGRIVVASWYGTKFHGKPMASGQPFNMHKLTVAHRTIPLGTKLLLTNPRNGRQVQARVLDRGPHVRGRQLDVSYAVACRLGFINRGVARLRMVILG